MFCIGCSKNTYEATSQEPSFLLEEVQKELESQLNLTRSSLTSESVFFAQNDIVPLWSKATVTATNGEIYCDIPVKSSKIYRLVLFDGLFYHLSEAHHSLTAIMSRGSITFYHHYFIPVLTEFSLPSNYSNVLYRGFCCHGERNGFSGFELYCTLAGRILSFDYYEQGSLINHIFAAESQKNEQQIIDFLKATVRYYYSIIKDTRSDFVCPYCGNGIFWEDPYLGYICTHCQFFSFYDGEIEASQIYGEYTGGGNWNGNGNNCPPIDPSGPGDDGGNNNGSSGSSSYTDHLLTTTYSGNNNITFCYPDSLSTEAIASLNATITAVLDSLSQLSITESLMNSLSNIPITFVYDTTITHPAEVVLSENKVKWRSAQTPIIAEELFHIFQHLNPLFQGLYPSNYEFEAKCFLVLSYPITYLTSLFGSLSSFVWNNAVQYNNTKNDTYRMNLINSMHTLMGYDMSTIQVLTNMLPNIDMLDIGTDE